MDPYRTPYRTPYRLVLATRNPGKIVEFRRILSEVAPAMNLEIELVGLDQFPGLEDVDETGSTFLENALLKARTISAETGLPAIADDSGLCIDALDGGPGIFSARWAGEHGNDGANVEKVLSQMVGIPDERRGAHFTCVTAFVAEDGSHMSEEGRMSGSILWAPIGTNGFGYDPIFRPVGSELSTAQFEAAAKDAISHRGQSLRAIAPRITAFLGALR